MITYEQAKLLKDAGFPQEGFSTEAYIPLQKGFGISNNEQYWRRDGIDYCYIPTLSELIDWCGDHIDGIARILEGKDIGGWTAFCRSDASGLSSGVTERISPTPEEAVARLWLAINEK